MRIIGGIFRGRKLKSLRGMNTRPTSDIVRESLFNVLGEKVVNSVFVDIFAGTGAVGIEALSRGARKVYFIEKDYKACKIIKENLNNLGVLKEAIIIKGEVPGIIFDINPEDDFDIIFLDPPYKKGLTLPSIHALQKKGLIKNNTLVIIQCPFDEKVDLPEGFSVIKEKKYGITKLIFFRRSMCEDSDLSR
ncbi:MAG: 16S rRNA (guanine(966)-N(2))-methyltransferase RsmD [Thermovenabulum sp.]|uniref:16S rRNA (guanine(966)-N(2))-methyltransferase RsmD n=1 Tax=Thermovenabulum sp. TaxID=3100335 RepID=UPI003C7A1526